MDNKQIVRTALKELFGQGDITALQRYWGEPYIQHNAGIPDGVDVLKLMIATTKNWTTYRILADGNFVVTQSNIDGWGP